MIDFILGWMVGSISGFFLVLAIWLAIGRLRAKFRRQK